MSGISLRHTGLAFFVLSAGSTTAYPAAPQQQAHVAARQASTSAVNATARSGNGTWFQPVAGTSFLWSLDENPPLGSVTSDTGISLNASVWDVDMFGTTAEQIAAYHQEGKAVICYISAGSHEPNRPDSGDFLPECYCNKDDLCQLDGWPGEYWLDLHTPACIENVQSVMGKRIALAQTKGCDGLEPDNTDSYLNDPGFSTTIDDEYNYLVWLSETAHNASLGIALKNGPDMITNRPAIVNVTDFAIVESCQEYSECSSYLPFLQANKPVWDTEYESKIECGLDGMQVTGYSGLDVDYKTIDAVCWSNDTTVTK